MTKRPGGLLPPRLTTSVQVSPLVLLTLALVGVPLILLITYSFRESSFLGVGSGPTLEQYQLVFESDTNLRVMTRTFIIAFSVAAISTVMAFVIAYAITFRMPRRLALVALGIVVASGVASFLVRVFASGIMLSPNGLINSALDSAGVIDAPLTFFYLSEFAIVVTMTYVYLPVAALIVYSAMQDIDPRSVEASRDLGAGRWRTIASVIAPQARVGLLAAFALTLILAGADFVTPRIVGGTSSSTVGASIQDLALAGGDLPGAGALAISFLAIVFLLVAGLALAGKLFKPVFARAGRALDPVAAKVAQHMPTSGRSISLPLTLFLLVYLTVPTILVIIFSFNSAPSVGLPLRGFTADWYPEIVSRAGFSDALRSTLVVTSAAVIGGLFIGIPVAFALRKLSGTWGRLVWVAVVLPFVIPGALVGSALLITTSETGVPLGLALTALVHLMLVASIIVVVVYTRLADMDQHLVEAARDLGGSTWHALRTVTLPLLLPSIIGGAVLGAAYSLDEIFVSTFTTGNENTLPIWLFGQARRGFTPGVNALGVLMLAGTLLAFTLAVLVARRSLLSVGRGGSA